ncbi:MAG: hypothetical protein IJ005_08470 [Bacteroidales bacterium]|nr:hypothetical protein [Bacteroidales bacterium]
MKIKVLLALCAMSFLFCACRDSYQTHNNSETSFENFFVGVWMTDVAYKYYSFFVDGHYEYDYVASDPSTEDGYRACHFEGNYYYNEYQGTIVLSDIMYMVQSKESDNIVLVNSNDFSVLNLQRKYSEPITVHSVHPDDWSVNFSLENSGSDSNNYKLNFQIEYPSRLSAMLISSSGIAVRCLNGEISNTSFVHKTTGENGEWKWYSKISNAYESYCGVPCFFDLQSVEDDIEIEYFIYYYYSGTSTGTLNTSDIYKITLNV